MKLICDLESIEVRDVFYVEQLYSQKHAHMLHKHTGILELLYIASGEGRYSVGNRAYAVRAGDLVVCNADVIHGEAPFQDHTIQTYCCALAGVQIEGLPGSTLLHTSHCPVIPLHGSAAEIGRITPVLYALHSAALDENRTVCQRLGTSVLLLTIHAIEEQDSSSKSGLEQKKEDLVRQITAYLDHHYTETVSLEEISESLHISQSHLSHLFKRETGVAPMQYIIQRRIGEAQSLLMETKLPIHTIEEILGFGSSCHFTAMFKKYVGIAPREYRKHFHSGSPEL